MSEIPTSETPGQRSSLALGTGSVAENELQAALAICHRLRDGAAQMTRQQFRNCLKRSIGADKDYADNCRRHFQDNPAAYLASRSPQTQSVELLRTLLKNTKPPINPAQTPEGQRPGGCL